MDDVLTALMRAAVDLDNMGTITSGHLTITEHGVRFTLFRKLPEEQLLHVQREVTIEELTDFRGGPYALCQLVVKLMVEKLDGAG